MASETKQIPFAKSIQAGLIGGGIAAVINLIIYFIGQAINGGSLMMQQGGQGMPLPIVMVILFSLVPGLIAGLLYALLGRFTANPKPIFLGVAAVVFIAFIFGPINAAVGAVTIWTLEIMHVVAALAIILSLFRGAAD